MKVFISWSGDRSRAVAEALRYWLPKVIQAVQPWMSANDIEKGSRWRTGISTELEQSSIGIICLTPENLASPWIHFEAGALSKQQQNTYVCTYLYKVDPVDVRDPLAQFQTTKAEREDTRKLLQSINNARSVEKLSENELNEQFDVWWPKLESRLQSIPATQEAAQPTRSEKDILEEILRLVRSLATPNTTPNTAPPIEYKQEFLSFIPERVSGNDLTDTAISFLSGYLGKPEESIRRTVFRRDDLFRKLDIFIGTNLPVIKAVEPPSSKKEAYENSDS